MFDKNYEFEKYYDVDINILCEEYKKYNSIDPSLFKNNYVKRGLRNADGTGVVAGVTNICNVHGYIINEREKEPVDGKLIYRGYDINDLINGAIAANRFGFEEVIWLILFGTLPNKEQLDQFTQIMAYFRVLPDSFTDDMIVKAPSMNIMIQLARTVLALYTFDATPDDTSLSNVMRQSIEIISCMPVIMVNSYQVKRRAFDRKSLYFHQPRPDMSTAQNILRLLRPDKQFTDEEAKLLDIMLILHAEHGGGNNSTFASRVVSSSGTDTYSAVAAAIGSLKGPKHGGANHKVMEMLEFIKEGVSNWEDETAVRDFLFKLLRKEAGDKSGLIYGIGHAVYTKSDPRAVILKDHAFKLATGTPLEGEFKLLSLVDKLAPTVFAEERKSDKIICANVDLYSGLVYKLLGIPQELVTPLFAVSRMAGWCAHRMEELYTSNRIIRPAYKAINKPQIYVPLDER